MSSKTETAPVLMAKPEEENQLSPNPAGFGFTKMLFVDSLPVSGELKTLYALKVKKDGEVIGYSYFVWDSQTGFAYAPFAGSVPNMKVADGGRSKTVRTENAPKEAPEKVFYGLVVFHKEPMIKGLPLSEYIDKTGGVTHAELEAAIAGVPHVSVTEGTGDDAGFVDTIKIDDDQPLDVVTPSKVVPSIKGADIPDGAVIKVLAVDENGNLVKATAPSGTVTVDGALSEVSENPVQNKVLTKLNNGETFTPTLYQDKSLNDDGGLVNSTGFVAFEPIYLFKGSVINLDLSSKYRMMIRYWATALNSTQCVRIFHKVGKFVCQNNGYYGVFFISTPDSSTGVTTTEIDNALSVYYDGNAQNNGLVDALNNGIYGHTYKLGYNQDGNIDSINNFVSATGHVGVLATYFYKGTVFNFDSSKYNVYLRYFGKEFEQGSSNLKQIGLINGGYKIEDEGFYSIGFNTVGNQGITIDTIEKNIFIEKPNYLTNEDGLIAKTSVSASDVEIIPTDTRNAMVVLPFKLGYGAYINCNDNSDLETLIYLYKNGVQVNDNSTFGMIWSKEQYMLAVSDCDTIEIRFRLYDGTLVKYLQESDILTIRENIYEFYCGTHQLTTDLGITKNNLDATIKGLMNSNRTTIAINHQGYNHYSLLSGYPISAKKGFQYGECDVKRTSDGVFVCCHDDSFVDENTQQTIVIAQHTYAELLTYSYHGEKIATLEQIIRCCKLNGIGLMIDHLGAGIIADIMPLVKKHSMERNVLWSISDTINGITAEVEAIVALDPKAEMITAFQTLSSPQIAELNALQEEHPLCHLIASVDFTQYTIAEYVEMSDSLNAGIDKGFWTTDKVSDIAKYLPYARYFISNKVSYRMIVESGIELE